MRRFLCDLYMGRGGSRTGFATFTSDTASQQRFSVPGGRQSDVGLPLVNIPNHGKHNVSGSLFFLQVLSLQDLCCRAVVSCTPVHLVDKLPLPVALRSHLKSFSMANGLNTRMMHGRSYSLTASSSHKRSSFCKARTSRPPQSPPRNCTRNSCKISQELELVAQAYHPSYSRG